MSSTSSESTTSTHVLFYMIPGWSHLRPCIVLACKLVRARNSVIVTIPVAGGFQPLVDKEIDRCLSSEEKNLKQNIHVINLGGEGRDALKLVPILLGGFESFYTSLHTLTPITCTTGHIHSFARAPDVVVAGIIMLDGLRTIRKLNQKIPIFSWHPSSLGPAMRIVGPEDLGGTGYIKSRAQELAEKTGKSYEEAKLEICNQQKGEVVHCPGMPPMYDYEYYPNLVGTAETIFEGIMSEEQIAIVLHECDGVICTSSTAVEPEACRAVKDWLAKTNRPLYVIGPLLPDSVLLEEQPAVLEEITMSTNNEGVVAFLDSIYATSGSHSLVYISFGSIFFPSGDSVWKAIETILNGDTPLLLAYDEERLGKIPEHIAEKFKASDRALTCIWAPQQTILRHHATGWFLTHCGQNSIIEAIVQGVPMIAWPMGAEQPGNAAYMTLILDIAYELVENRSGPGLKPMYRGIQPQGTPEALEKEIQVTLNKAFGDDGKVKRANIRVLRDKVKAGLLKEGGDSFVDFQRFVQDYIHV